MQALRQFVTRSPRDPLPRHRIRWCWPSAGQSVIAAADPDAA